MSDYILAKAFAFANDKEQADIINLLARELYVLCESNRRGVDGFDGQLCFMSKYINKDGEHFLRRLVKFLDLRNEDMSK